MQIYWPTIKYGGQKDFFMATSYTEKAGKIRVIGLGFVAGFGKKDYSFYNLS